MKTITRADGNITFTLPDGASTPADIPVQAKRRRRGAGTPDEPFDLEISNLLSALTEDEERAEGAEDYQVLDRFAVDVGEGAKRTPRRGAAARPDEMAIDVKLDPGEGAVLLIEQDGTYEWHFPEKTTVQRGPKRRGRPGAVEHKTVVFRVPIGDGDPPRLRRSATRSHRGPITNFIKGKITGFVLKFAARKVVGALSKRLEKGVTPGPVIITSHDTTEGWRHEVDFLSVTLPQDRPARILLLVHGTFSSTLGSFGSLTAQPAGQRFLDLAFQHYDAVLGHDHYTLAETPEQNAEALFEDLLKLQRQSKGIEFDAISYSRGGLVYRYLTEQIVPLEKTQLAFRKSIFVGCTNAGTELANEENWKHLVDFYTNMVAGTSRLLGLLPGAKLPTQIFSQSIKIIGSLVKYMAQDAVSDNAVPGLAAMKPEGDFVKAMNALPASRTRPGASSYYAIGSDFEPDGNTSAGELGKRIIFKVADGFVDKLMGEANDLVVDTDSMFIVDPVPSAQLMEKLPFSENGEIYHTVYFNQPQVARQFSQWLGLVQAPLGTQPGAPRTWWNEAVCDDFRIMPGQVSVRRAMKSLEQDDSRFVVIQRPHGDSLLHYGIPRTVLLESIRAHSDKQDTLVEMLNLHEDESRGVSLDQAIGAANASELTRQAGPEHGRYASVVLSETGPVGVVSPPSVLTPNELQEEAAAVPRRRPAARKTAARKKAVRRRGARSARASTTRRAAAVRRDGAPASGSAPAEAPAPQSVWCNAHAVMPEEAVIGKKAAVEVTLSRDEIIRDSGVFGGGEVDLEKNLIVQVLARKHCRVSGEARVELPVPGPGEEIPLFFDVVPKYEGIGQVDVIVRQGNRPIATLRLFPKFVIQQSSGVIEPTAAEAELRPVDTRRELPDVLYIREGEMGLKRVLHFDFEARSINKIVRCTSEPFQDAYAREKYISSLYQAIEEFWADDELEYESFMRKLQARGVEIFDKLFPLELRRVLWEARDSLETIHVYSDEPFIPWELAYLKEPGKTAKRDSCFLAEKGMVRWLPDADQFPPLKLRLREGRAAYVIPKYPRKSNSQLPGAQEERKMLEKVLAATPVTPTSIKVQDALEIPGHFDILHFACHGLADSSVIWDSGLMMTGRVKNGSYLQDDLMSSQVEAFADLQEEASPGPLVFLNACQVGRQGYGLTGTGGFAKAFVKRGAGAFISTHWSVGDNSAYDFSETLYTELLNGKDMMTSVAAAREAAKNKDEVTWLAYVVYADPYAQLVKE